MIDAVLRIAAYPKIAGELPKTCGELAPTTAVTALMIDGVQMIGAERMTGAAPKINRHHSRECRKWAKDRRVSPRTK